MDRDIAEDLINEVLDSVLYSETKRQADYEQDLDEFAEDLTQKVLHNVLLEENNRRQRYEERKLDEEITGLIDWMLDNVVSYVRRDERLDLTNVHGPSSSVVSLAPPSFDLTTIGLKVFDTEFQMKMVMEPEDFINKPPEIRDDLARIKMIGSLRSNASPPLDNDKWTCPFNKITRVYSNAAYNEGPEWLWKVVVGYPKLCHPHLQRKFGHTNLGNLYDVRTNETEKRSSTSTPMSENAGFAEPPPVRRTGSKIKQFFRRLFKPRRINWTAEADSYDSFDQKMTEFIERNRRSVFKRRFKCACFGGRRSTAD